MDQHVGQEAPRLLPLVGVVYKYLRDGARGVSLALGGVIAEQHYLRYWYDDHADGWRPAGILLLVGAVYVSKYALAMALDCITQHNKDGGKKGRDFFECG